MAAKNELLLIITNICRTSILSLKRFAKCLFAANVTKTHERLVVDREHSRGIMCFENNLIVLHHRCFYGAPCWEGERVAGHSICNSCGQWARIVITQT